LKGFSMPFIKFPKIAEFYAYALKKPTTVHSWESGPLVWERTFVVKTDQHEAVIISANVLERIWAWFVDLFGNYYAKKLGTKKVTFIPPCSVKEIIQKANMIGKQNLVTETNTAQNKPPGVSIPNTAQHPKVAPVLQQTPVLPTTPIKPVIHQ